VSWWRGEDNTIDRVGGNDGTLEGAGYTVGKVGQAFFITGDGSAVTVGSATNLQFQNFTIECWIRRADRSFATQDGSGVGALFAFGSGGYGFGLYDAGQLGLGAVDGIVVESSTVVVDTNFHHVAVTKSGTNVTFYLDGVGYPTGGMDVAFTFTTSPAIGAIGDTLQNSFYGTIDEMSIYNQALSGADIAAIYGARAAGKCVPPVPIIAAQPASQTVTAYSPASFSILADGPVPLLYQWAFDGTNLTGATNSTLSFDAALPSEAGTYSVIVGTAPNTTNSSNAVLTVILPPAPTILTQPATHIGIVDDYTTFTVVAQSQAPVPMSYQWSFDGSKLTGETNSELLISNLIMANGGTYTVQVSNPFFATNSQSAILTMIPAPTGTNRIVANLDANELTKAVEAGGSVTFVCSGTLTLSQPMTVTRDLVVEGSNTIVLSGRGRSQILAVPLGVNATLRDLVLTDGFGGDGGAISNGGDLSISNVTFTNNIAIPRGGAIYNTGTLSLTNALFLGNSAVEGSSSCGGAVCSQGGSVNMQNVSFSDNVAEGEAVDGTFAAQGWGYGGALYCVGGSMNASAVECTNNAALSGNGLVGPTYEISGAFGVPGAGEGGGIYLSNTLAILSGGSFVSNFTTCSTAYNEPTASSEGGALFNAGWTALTGIGFQGNYCLGAAGAPGSDLGNIPDSGAGGGPGTGGTGGAVCNVGLLMMTNCSFVGNAVTASNGGAGSTCVECNPPYTGPNGAPGNALGGALANFGTLDIFSNAFLNNSAAGTGTDVGTIYNVGNMDIDASTTISPDTVDSNPGAFAASLVVEPQSEVVAAGTTVTLTALAVGSPNPTYQWSLDGTNLASATAPTLILTNIQLSQSGTYWVEATNAVGSETSAPIVLTVLAAPVTLTGSSLGSAGFSISGTGVPGVNFVIEVSTNLIEWQPLQTNPSPFTFIDTNTSTAASRYYRAAVAQ
jgi:predicted outer membrane repeat protein